MDGYAPVTFSGRGPLWPFQSLPPPPPLLVVRRTSPDAAATPSLRPWMLPKYALFFDLPSESDYLESAQICFKFGQNFIGLGLLPQPLAPLPLEVTRELLMESSRKWQENRHINFRGGSTLGQGAHASPQIHLLPPPQIQKLDDHSSVISEVPKCSKIQISPWRILQYFPRPLADEIIHCSDQFPLLQMPSPQELYPRSQPFGPRFYGSLDLIHYRVATILIIDFKCKPIMKFVFFGFGERTRWWRGWWGNALPEFLG